jgi:carbon-monoxide dehydrogenase small subunit
MTGRINNMQSITITLNGEEKTVYFEGSETLLDILRDNLDLTGTKYGCGQGACGACTVVVNGKAVRSCMVLFRRLDSAEILTIEGLSKDGKLHPIQRAFIDEDAIHCGFCTPGIVMELYALFNQNPDASEEEIKKALNGHLCRCTGYLPLIEAAKLAQKYYKESLNKEA